MESPDIHYNNPTCPHQGCTQRLEWIDFQLELFGDLQRIYNPLVRAWWEGKGFVGQCPTCGGWIRFTTLAMEALCDTEAARYLTLPENWHAVAQLG